jgi:hypothetical protein
MFADMAEIWWEMIEKLSNCSDNNLLIKTDLKFITDDHFIDKYWKWN